MAQTYGANAMWILALVLKSAAIIGIVISSHISIVVRTLVEHSGPEFWGFSCIIFGLDEEMLGLDSIYQHQGCEQECKQKLHG